MLFTWSSVRSGKKQPVGEYVAAGVYEERLLGQIEECWCVFGIM